MLIVRAPAAARRSSRGFASPRCCRQRPSAQDQKSIWTPIFRNRGVNTDVGAIQACDPVVVAGLKFWLYVRIAPEFVALQTSIPIVFRVRPKRRILAKRRSRALTRSPQT